MLLLLLLPLLLPSCRQSGCWVLLFSPASWLVPTRTPSLTQGCGTESRDGWQVTARRGPGSGWCSGSRWAPASGRSSLEGCWLLLLPFPPGGGEVERQCQFLLQIEAEWIWWWWRLGPPFQECCLWDQGRGGTLCEASRSEGPEQTASVCLPHWQDDTQWHFQKEVWHQVCQGYRLLFIHDYFNLGASQAAPDKYLFSICSVNDFFSLVFE